MKVVPLILVLVGGLMFIAGGRIHQIHCERQGETVNCTLTTSQFGLFPTQHRFENLRSADIIIRTRSERSRDERGRELTLRSSVVAVRQGREVIELADYSGFLGTALRQQDELRAFIESQTPHYHHFAINWMLLGAGLMFAGGGIAIWISDHGLPWPSKASAGWLPGRRKALPNRTASLPRPFGDQRINALWAWIFLLLFGFFSAIFIQAIRDKPEDQMMQLFLLFPAASVLIGIEACRKSFMAWRDRKAELDLQVEPRPGGLLLARFRWPRRSAFQRGLAMIIQCQQRRTIKSGNKTSTRMHLVWGQEQKLTDESFRAIDGARECSVEFALPADAPASQSGPERVAWTLWVHEIGGIAPFEAAFAIPVAHSPGAMPDHSERTLA